MLDDYNSTANPLEFARYKKLKGSMVERNEPDWLIGIAGRLVFIELKLPGEVQSKAQELRMHWWSQCGARCAVCTDAGSAYQVIMEELAKSQQYAELLDIYLDTGRL